MKDFAVGNGRKAKRKQRDYTTIYNSVLRDTRLNLRDRGFLAFVLSFDDDFVWNRKYVMKELQISKSTLYDIFKNLKAAGYMADFEVANYKEGVEGFNVANYLFYEVPITDPRWESIYEEQCPKIQDTGVLKNGTLSSVPKIGTHKNTIPFLKEDKYFHVLANAKEVELPFHTQAFAEAWGVWVKYKQERRDAYRSETSLKSLFAELRSWGEDKSLFAISKSIRQNWKGIFEPSAKEFAAAPITKPTYDPNNQW